MTAWNHDINAAPRDGTRILLAEKIANGLRELSAAMSERNMDMELPDGTIDPTIAAEGNHIGLAEPVIVNGRRGNQAKPVSLDPVPTLDTKGGVWLAEAVVNPIVLANRTNNAARSPDDPAPVFTTAHGGGVAVATPIILSQHTSGAPRSTEEPIPTVTTGGAGDEERPGCARPMLVEPFVATVAHGNSEGDGTADSRRVHSVEEPLGALHAGGGKYGVVEAFILSQGAGGVPREVGEPVPTIPTGGAHALIASYYGASMKAQPTEEPLPTVTTKDRFGIVMPVTHNDGSDRARDVGTDPVPTITGANRGELAFITAQHGEREGQAPRVHDIDEPAPTIAATGHVDLAEAVEQGDMPRRYDILFRMLEPHELAAAMGFTTDEADYEFAGTKTEQIRQIGNAVSVRKMQACVGAIMADAAPKRTGKPATEGRRSAAA